MDVLILGFLKEILQEAGISNLLYSVGGYSDDAVCIQKQNDEWVVYYGIRLDKKQIKTYPLTCVHSAILDFLGRLIPEEIFMEVRKKYFEKVFAVYNECYLEKSKSFVRRKIKKASHFD